MTHRASFPRISVEALESLIVSTLDERKAEDIVILDLTGKADFADRMVIATGTSQRHVGSLADSVAQALKQSGFEKVAVEGMESCEWVLVDAGDIIVHLFKPEARVHYNLEKMWSVSTPSSTRKRLSVVESKALETV